MGKIMTQKFFARSATTVAKDLLGKYLVRKIGGKEVAVMITEVEAYDGPKDLACHASRGKTKRNEVMFGPAGCWYVYFIYGTYWMLNAVTGPEDYPAAILIRGTDKIRGPGRLTRDLKINKNLNGKKVSRSSGLWVEDKGIKVKKSEIVKTPRIGVNYAGPIWSKKHYRFTILLQ